jgi:hypothetical protein
MAHLPNVTEPERNCAQDVWLANQTGPASRSQTAGSPGVHASAVYKLSTPVAIPQVVCLADRYVVILGGRPAKGCTSTAIHALDLEQPPAKGSVLPLLPFSLNSSLATATALSFGDTALIYDGATAHLLKVA